VMIVYPPARLGVVWGSLPFPHMSATMYFFVCPRALCVKAIFGPRFWGLGGGGGE
jgi:hypothetical protein